MSPILLLIVFVLALYHLYRYATYRPPNFPPGPPRLPIFGSYWFVLLQNYKFLHIAYHKLAKKYKTKILGLHLGPYPTVVVNDYELVRQVLLRPEFQGRVKLDIINIRTYNENLGIIFTDGELWNTQKRFSQRYFRDQGFGRRFLRLEEISQEEIQDTLDLLHERRKDEEIFQNGLALVPELYHSLFYNAMWFMFTGQRFPVSEHKKLRYHTREAMRFQKSIDVTGDAVALALWLRHLAPKLTGFTDLMESTGNLLRLVEEAVVEHKKNYSDDGGRDFMDRYLQEMKKNEDPTFNDHQLNVLGFDYLLPAATTVTATLNFATAFLLNHPEVQTKMQKEIDEVVGRDKLPTLDDRQSMPYNEAVLREVMRKETLVPLSVVHRCTEDTILGDYTIPKDTAVIPNLWSFHMDPEFWGDPEVFRPERFLDDNGQLLKKDYTLPFGAGKRLCAGETFARQQMFLMLTSLLQNFTMKCAPGTKCPSTEADLPGIIVSKIGYWVRFEPRK